jgi:hypothetical protein
LNNSFSQVETHIAFLARASVVLSTNCQGVGILETHCLITFQVLSTHCLITFQVCCTHFVITGRATCAHFNHQNVVRTFTAHLAQ